MTFEDDLINVDRLAILSIQQRFNIIDSPIVWFSWRRNQIIVLQFSDKKWIFLVETVEVRPEIKIFEPRM